VGNKVTGGGELAAAHRTDRMMLPRLPLRVRLRLRRERRIDRIAGWLVDRGWEAWAMRLWRLFRLI
jgi:hypothetical protein